NVLLLPIFLIRLLCSGVLYWIAVNEGKDGTVPALKQVFFIFVGYAGMFLACRLSQFFIWKVAPFFYGFSFFFISALY
ncbi:FtsW/RodA/SpoVE family cell cycle protein, partial [Enterococcus faecalis]